MNAAIRYTATSHTILPGPAIRMVHNRVVPARSLHTTHVVQDRSFTNLLADDDPPPVQVSSISDPGIQLADGLVIPGPSIFLEGKVFLWDVPQPDLKSRNKEDRWRGWAEERFELFEVVSPRPGMF